MTPSPTSARPAPPCAFDAIDWNRPWLAPWRRRGEPAARHAARVGTLGALQALAPGPVAFVAQAGVPAHAAYESHVFETGQCPVREGLHDFFNGLCWNHFPHSKQRLNQLQAQAIARQGGVQRRGPVRDAITLLDENGALLIAPPEVLQPLWRALRAHDWRQAFVVQRPLWQQARLVLFGHALLEKLVSPRKAITAHAMALPMDARDLDTLRIDRALAPRLEAGALAAKPFTPLPVLGVPGWWAANAADSFYDDASVFRPARPQNRPGALPPAIPTKTSPAGQPMAGAAPIP